MSDLKCAVRTAMVKKRLPTKSYVMYDSEEATRTLQTKFITPYHKQAQWAELTQLKIIVGDTYDTLGRPLTIFDIGIGHARVPLLLSEVATWNKIAKYVGVDNSETCIARAKRIIKTGGIANKVEVFLFDAKRLGLNSHEILKKNYDLVICTYFTAGDFEPREIGIQTKENRLVDYDINALKPNKNFIAVFKGAFDMLSNGGKIVIGSIYRDNDFVRKIQEDFYKRCGMSIITSTKDSFTATKEGFWSERFSEQKIYNYLSWIPREKIEFIRLDDYNFALMVIINK